MESQQRSNTLSRTTVDSSVKLKKLFSTMRAGQHFFGKSTLFRKIKKYQKEIYLRLIFFQYNIGINEYIFLRKYLFFIFCPLDFF